MTDHTAGRVSFDMTFDAKMVSPEEFAYRDAIRWQLKPFGAPCDVPYLYCVNNRLYANAPTELPKATRVNNAISSTSYQHWLPPLQPQRTPTLLAGVQSSDNTAACFGKPYQQQAVDFDGTIGAATYVVIAEFRSGPLRLVVDTGSDISWVRSVPIPTSDKRYLPTLETTIPLSQFDISYCDKASASGVVCKDYVRFGEGERRFGMPWAFGAATTLNPKAIQDGHEGLLALGSRRPSAQPGSFSPSADSLMFVEALMKAGLIQEPYFTIRLRVSTPSTIVFGKLPDLGSNNRFYFQPTRGGRWAVSSKYIAVIKPSATKDKERITYSYKTHMGSAAAAKNSALLDTGTEYIFLHSAVVEWIYKTLCGENGFFETPDGYYITETGLRRLRGLCICIDMGEVECRMPAMMLQGSYSFTNKAIKGTIYSIGGGSAIDDAIVNRNTNVTYDIYGAAFLRYVWVAFDAQMSRPRIAISSLEPQ